MTDPTVDAATVGRIAAAMNHEHGNLLAALKAWIEAPALGMPADEAMQNAGKVLERLLRIQRAEQVCVSGLMKEASGWIRLDEVLDHALALATPRLRSKGIGLAFDPPEESPSLNLNAGRAIADVYFLLLETAELARGQAGTLILAVDVQPEAARIIVHLAKTPEDPRSLTFSRT